MGWHDLMLQMFMYNRHYFRVLATNVVASFGEFYYIVKNSIVETVHKQNSMLFRCVHFFAFCQAD